MNCLDRHAALVLHEFLVEGEMVVRYGQTIINLRRIFKGNSYNTESKINFVLYDGILAFKGVGVS